MTREGIETLVAEWLPRMHLSHWKVTIDWSKPVEDDTAALVEREDTYDITTMRFSAEYPTWTEQYAEWTVVHELMHLVTRDLEQAVEASHDSLPAAARKLADARFEHELEGVVDRTARVLVELWAPGRLMASLWDEEPQKPLQMTHPSERINDARPGGRENGE